MTFRHFIIVWLALCIILTVVGFIPLLEEEPARELHSKSIKELPGGWNKSKPDPWSEEWRDGAYEFRTLWYEIVY